MNYFFKLRSEKYDEKISAITVIFGPLQIDKTIAEKAGIIDATTTHEKKSKEKQLGLHHDVVNGFVVLRNQEEALSKHLNSIIQDLKLIGISKEIRDKYRLD